jgi:putative colanic acid biosynthesis UDP-glucose lipid carrier transferase
MYLKHHFCYLAKALMKKNQNFYTLLRYLLDAISIFAAYGLIQWQYHPVQNESLLFYFYPFILLATWYFAGIYSKLYEERRSNKFSEEIIFIFYNTILFTILSAALLAFMQPQINMGLVLFLRLITAIFILATVTKYIHRKYIHSILSQGKMFDKILLVGGGNAAQFFYETVNKYYYYGYTCVGFVDNNITKLNGCKYYGPIHELQSVLQKEIVDEVVITLTSEEHELIKSCVDVCEVYKVQTRILPDAYKYSTTNVQVDNIGILPVLNISGLPLDLSFNKFIKRIFDIIFSVLFFSTLGIIVFPIIALLIKLTSKGPIFFKQERWGLNNAKITCYKFRTMVKESTEVDEKGKYKSTIKNDPRITRVGSILRKTNLDELPQFWNVLVGNMSIVGPRPHPTPMNLESMHTVENYMLRHSVLPGITGWAQVNGLRGEVKTVQDMQRRVDFDLYYIHRWTFWLDSQIILQTIINFIRGDQNAY